MKIYQDNKNLVVEFEDEVIKYKERGIKFDDLNKGSDDELTLKFKNGLVVGNKVYLKRDVRDFSLLGLGLASVYILGKELFGIKKKIKDEKEREEQNKELESKPKMSQEELSQKLSDFYKEQGCAVVRDGNELGVLKTKVIDKDKISYSFMNYKPLEEEDKNNEN